MHVCGYVSTVELQVHKLNTGYMDGCKHCLGTISVHTVSVPQTVEASFLYHTVYFLY